MAEDNSIERYKEILAAYNQTQGDLDSMGLTPEVPATENPVENMINQANEEEALMKVQLAKLKRDDTEAKLIEKTADASNNLYNKNNETPEQTDERLSRMGTSLTTGTDGDEEREIVKELHSKASEPTPISEKELEADFGPVVDEYADKPVQKELSPQEALLQKLKKAREERAFKEGLADISQGVSRASAAYIGDGLTNIKTDPTRYDDMRKRAARGVTEVESDIKLTEAQKANKLKAERQAKLDKLNTEYKTAQLSKMLKENAGEGGLSKDPNSDESKAAQDQAMALMGTLGIKYDPEKITKMNADTIGSKNFTAGLRKSVNKLSLDKHEATETERFNKWTEKKEDDLVKSIKEFNADKEVIRANSMISGSKIARDMVASGNPIAAASVPNFLARASGEVGALTEADKEPFGGTRAIVERSKQAVQQMIDGNLTEANKKFVMELADVYEKTAARVKTERADERAGQLGGIDFPVKMLRGRFMGTDATGLQEQKLPVTSRTLEGKDKQAYDWAKANETDPRAKAILKKLGME